MKTITRLRALGRRDPVSGGYLDSRGRTVVISSRYIRNKCPLNGYKDRKIVGG